MWPASPCGWPRSWVILFLYHYKTGRASFCLGGLCVCVCGFCSSNSQSHSQCPVFLSSFDQLACLGKSCFLSELTLDGNPVALETWYKQAVLRCVLHLRQLDMKRITVRIVKCVSLWVGKSRNKLSFFTFCHFPWSLCFQTFVLPS